MTYDLVKTLNKIIGVRDGDFGRTVVFPVALQKL